MLQAILDFWAQHAPVLSVLLPVFTAMLLLLLGDHDGCRRRAVVMPWHGRAGAGAGSAWAPRPGPADGAGLVWRAASGELLVYELGEWPAPFGIVLVVDRLSALMVLLTT
jgi:multicomponent K+:H+ antiporter subunit D